MNDIQQRSLSHFTDIITNLLISHTHRSHAHVHRAGETLYGSGESPGLEARMKEIGDEIGPLEVLERSLAKEYGLPDVDIDSDEVFAEAKSRASEFGKDDPGLEENARKLDKLQHLRVELSDLQHLGCGISLSKVFKFLPLSTA